MLSTKIKKYITENTQEIINIRRELHKNPELSNLEFNTSLLIQNKLTEYGVYLETGFAKSGILGVIEGKKPGKTVALRADMDALPIIEKNESSYKSQNEGAMHACGHDAHTAMLLGVASVLAKIKDDIPGTILLVFQPAEEDAPTGGAQAMLDDGLFNTFKPDVIYGQHVWPDLPVGQIGIRDKEMMGASDRLKIRIKGRGGHASMPHQTNDAVVTAGYLITALQTIVSRSLDPLQASVVTIAKINGGYASNIIADEVTLEGSIRTYDSDIREKLRERLYQICESVGATFESDIEVSYTEGYEPTINTPKWAKIVRESAQEMLGGIDATPELDPALTAEDFSRFLNAYPGAFIWLGTRIEDSENQKSLHDAEFKLNEDALSIGSELMIKTAINTLEELNKEMEI